MALLGMGGGNRTWILKVVADVKDAQNGIADVEKSTKTFGDRAKGLGKTVAGALGTAAVIGFGKSIVDAASNLEQSLGGARTVFGEFSGEIEAFGKNAAKNMGVSNEEFLRMSTLMGSLMKGAGLPLQTVTKQTETLTQRAADLSAMYGGTATQAIEAMNSAMKGQFDPLESFGVSLTAAQIEARAMAKGYVDASGKVDAAGKMIAAQELILERSSDAAGTYAKESGTLAGQTQTMQAQFKDLQATLGQALLPTIVQLAGVLRPILEFISANTGWLIPMAGAILGIVAAVKAWTIAQVILNSALFANPVGLIILAVAALGVAIVALVRNWDTVKEVVAVVTDAIVAAWNWVVDSVKYLMGLLFDIYTYPYRKAWELIQYIVKLIVEAWRGFVDTMRWLFGQVYDVITYPFRRAWDFVKYIGEQLGGIWTGFLGTLRYVFGQVYDVITYPFRRAMDAIKWLWNTTVGGFGFTLPSWIPGGIGGKEFRIPKMAEGGIVNRPTLAMIGEAGPEAVIPLGRSGNAFGTTINVYVSALNADADTGRLIAQSLREYNRTAGTAVP